MDQPNPWQQSSRAHHAVDLLLLFGSYDLTFNPAAQRVSTEMMHKWIEFANGLEPWQPDSYFAFGPLGQNGPISNEDFAARRRQRHCRAIEQCDAEKVAAVWKSLAVGNISLEN